MDCLYARIGLWEAITGSYYIPKEDEFNMPFLLRQNRMASFFFLLTILFISLSLTACQYFPDSIVSNSEYDDLLIQVDELTQMVDRLTERVNQLSVHYEDLLIINRQLMASNQRLQKMIDHNGIAQQLAILNYHHLYDGDLKGSVYEGNGAVISVDMFREQMDYLRSENFYTATIEELQFFMEGKIDLPKKTVVITFDDGYYSNFEYAYPILKERGFKAALFVVGLSTERASNGEVVNPRLIRMTYDDIEQARDVFTIGNHSYDLHYLKDNQAVALLSTEEEIKADILKVQELLNTRYFAYPYGKYNETVVKVLKETNHLLAFTVDEGYFTPETPPYGIPRFGVFPYMTLSKFKGIVHCN